MNAAAEIPDRHWRICLALVPLVVGSGLRFWHSGPPAFPTDDTYIALHAARFLFRADPAYPGVPSLNGATSLLHVLTLRAAMAVLPPLWAAEVLAWLGAMCYLSGAAVLITARTPWGLARVLCMTIATLLAATTFHLSSGQETSWAMAAVVRLLHWMSIDAPGRRRVPILAGLLPALRPDLGLLTLVIAVTRSIKDRSFVIRDAALMGAALLPVPIVYRLAIGRFLPNTIAAKVAYFGLAAYPLATKVQWTLLLLLPWLVFEIGVNIMGLWLAWQSKTDRPAVFALLGFVVALMVFAPVLLTVNDWRYLHPLMVPTVIAGFARWAANRRTVVFAVLWLAVVWTLANLPANMANWRRHADTTIAAQQEIATWLNTHERPGVPVMLHDAGYLSETTRAHLIDFVGLKSPASIPVHQRFTAPSLGAARPEALQEIACDTYPEYFVVYSQWDRDYKLTEGLRRFGWHPTRILQHVIDTSADPIDFSLYHLTPSAQCGT